MNIHDDDLEYNVTHIPMFQKVVDMFDGRPNFQRIIRLGILANMGYDVEYDDTSVEDYDLGSWVHSNKFTGHDNGADRNTLGSSSRHLPSHYYSAIKESESGRRARCLEEERKRGEKAAKKRLKKQKQKERKQNEKLENQKQNLDIKNEEEKVDGHQCKADKPENEKSKSSVKESASAKHTDSSDSSDEDGDSQNGQDDSEELDMTSTFVTKAALIVKRKFEQKEKKKSPVKEHKTAPEKSPEQPEEVEKKGSAAPSSPTFKDNVGKSADLANTGNKFAGAGDFNMAVRFFTEAIKYNPKEYKLFGNRSFCFEKMQEYMKALCDAELSLSLCPGWVKGLFRKGRALAGLKRYEEAAQAFKEVLKQDGPCAEATQELMRVQIAQLMEFGFTREQSGKALIIHGTVEKALEVLSSVNQPDIQDCAVPLAQAVNVSGVSPLLSAKADLSPEPRAAPTTQRKNKPSAPLQTTNDQQSVPHQANENTRTPQELFPVWVGNLFFPVTENLLTDLFKKVGVVHSVRLLTHKRCAFVNFTKKEDCEEAIRRIHGFHLNGTIIAVRYPDRIPSGMGISKSALKADDLHTEYSTRPGYFDRRYGVEVRKDGRPCRHVPKT